MRHVLLITLLLTGVGCQTLHDRGQCKTECATSEPCPALEKKVCAPAPGKPKVTAPPVEAPKAAAIPQEIMLVPTMVYRPFIAANPTMPVRMGPNMTVAQPPPSEEAPPPKTEETLKKALETCDKLQDRIIYLEKCLSERGAPVACPSPCREPLLPLFRRPLFNRSEPIFNRCEPQCEPQCETPAAVMPPAKDKGSPAFRVPSLAPFTVSPLPASSSPAPEPLLQMPTRKTTVETIR